MDRRNAFFFFAALILRLAVMWQFGPSVIRFGDAPDYLSAAASLCSTGSYPDRSSLPFFRAPGLPFFIAAATLCHTNAVWVVKIALASTGALAVVIMFLLAEDLFRDRRASLLAAGTAAVYPFFVVQSCDIQTEAPFMLLLLAAIRLTLKAGRTGSRPPIFLGGLCAGLAALVRPIGLVLLLLLPLQILMLETARVRGQVRSLLLLWAGAASCLAPWVIRNEFRFHELILVNDAGGYNFWRGTSPEMAAISRIDDAEAFTKASEQFEKAITPAIARKINQYATTPGSRSRNWFKRAFQNLAKDPAGFMARLLRNAWVYWRPWLNPVTSSRAVVALSGLMVTALYSFGLHGWTLLRQRDSRMALWCLISTLAFWILQTPFQVVTRFRIPITDPFLIVFAAASVSAFLPRHRPPYDRGRLTRLGIRKP
ncbi:MAG TPA: glycosyltransferase family 39 protein [Bryobacteraceae bacterium]|nr:glycosyltransferase family 39 protein [Bryobacteraceae bacterium]